MLFKPLVVLASALAASALKLSGKVSTTTADGSDKSYPLDQVPAITLDSSTWKLTFNTDSIPLNQAHLLFEAPSGDVSIPVSVKRGKGSFTINPAKPPSALLSSSGKFDVTLLLSTHNDAISKSLGSITLPGNSLKPVKRRRNDLPAREGEPAFKVQPELYHTFDPEPKEVGAFLSLIGTGLVLAPWVLFAALYARLSPRLTGLSAHSSLFLLTLSALEGLIVVYWLKLKLYHFLPVFVPLSLITAYTGKLAISRK